MERADRDVDEFLASLPDAVRDDMAALDRAIGSAMAGAPRVLYEGRFWGGSDQEIVGYGSLTTTRADGDAEEWFVVGLAAQRRHLSVYISAVEDGEYLSEKYGADLGKVKPGKSSLGFRSVEDIDLGRLVDLVARARAITEEG